MNLEYLPLEHFLQVVVSLLQVDELDLLLAAALGYPCH